MSIQRQFEVICDLCDGNQGYSSHYAEDARADARDSGWVRKAGKDVCPKCKEVTA